MGVPIGGNSPQGGDIFLMVKGAKTGVIKGESQDDAHKGEIDIVSWSWGMEAFVGIGGGGQKKASVRELKLVKRVDSSSTALMAALRNNEPISKAVLTMRKAGKTPLEYLKVTIENGRVTEVALDVVDNSPDVMEQIRFSFNKITVEYVPQGKDGQALGGMVYVDQFGE